jgi:hypothetical protein
MEATIMADKTFVLRPGRTLALPGGYGVDRRLSHTHSTDAVWWSPTFNSYVAVYDQDRVARYPRSDNRSPYFIASVNGIGEIRWTIELDPTHGYSGDQASRDAVAYLFEEQAT